MPHLMDHGEHNVICLESSFVCTACMHRRADMYSITILATSLKLLKKPSTTGKLVKTKTAQYMHDIELHFTEKKDTNKKSKLSKPKGCKTKNLPLVHNVN